MRIRSGNVKHKARTKRGCRYWLNLLAVGVVSFLLLGYAGYIGLLVYGLSQPARTPVCCITPADMGFDYEDVHLGTDDGLTLVGWYIPSQNGAAVILLHGYGANRMEMIGRAGVLARHGYGVLLYDQRASGESEGKYRSFGWADAADVAVAVAFLQAREDVDAGRIGILGFSQGGATALRATAETDQIRAIVAEEPGFATIDDLPVLTSFSDRWIAFNYRLTLPALAWRTGVQEPAGIVEGLARIPPRPLFFIATGPTEEAGYWLVRHFYDQAGEPKTWWHVLEASHGQIPALYPREYEKRIVSFFDEALLDGSDSE
jgi:fermentation-respiration switch protein FrsA (DUF1100 family)